VSADPGVLAGAEEPVRRELGLPPYRAQALVSGPMADAYGRALADAAGLGIEVRGPSDGAWSVLAPDPAVLADLLAAVPRPPGRLRVEVDPVRA
jgi:primosomal protein N' (replication factor Y)